MADAGFLQFLAYFAKLPPSERPSALENIVGVPPHMVASELPKFERMAAQQGHELSGGFSAAGGEAGEEGGAAGPLDSGPVSCARIWEATKGRIWEWGGLALFWGAVPLILFLIKERRGLSWGSLASQALRVPFSFD